MKQVWNYILFWLLMPKMLWQAWQQRRMTEQDKEARRRELDAKYTVKKPCSFCGRGFYQQMYYGCETQEQADVCYLRPIRKPT